ncbi:hypothetical protein E5161_05745 [Cohnella pontilimi]|uniref:SbsC C-terminal domain-containing protein n=1 Tax=Cohnella pontilimi TaxID=2564100 RepID=A0A4U0FEY8_9BACL|nr:hypothetical protein [Cohnella pontilimi]TJY43391.1 hypothetical protein E5161_05745 [Cohnella pontilimi]
MRRLSMAALIMVSLLLTLSRNAALMPVYAQPLPEETRKLLEKSLSIVEIDREIDRIGSLKTTTETEIRQTENRLAQQEIAIAAQREKAGKVLRSYYVGQRDFVLAALLNANSLPQLLRTWEIMDLILQSDRTTMNEYAAQYAKLKDGYKRLQQDKNELAAVESNLKQQRERLLALQDELNKALAASGDEAHIRQLMAEMQAYWNNIGLYEVNRHFRELAEAMKALPEWIQQHPETMETSGFKTKLTITDTQLNDFLRSRSDEFKQFAIRFEKDRMSLEGDNGNLQIRIIGHYSLENEPENAILFHVDSLNFNGLELPDTTRADLQRNFDLGFYPQKLIKFVKAQSVSLEEGRLIVQLKLG